MKSNHPYDIEIVLRVGSVGERRVPLAEFACALRVHPEILAAHCEGMFRVADPEEIKPFPAASQREGGTGGKGPVDDGSIDGSDPKENIIRPVVSFVPIEKGHGVAEAMDAPAAHGHARRFAEVLDDLEHVKVFERLVERLPMQLLEDALKLTLSIPPGKLKNRAAYFTHCAHQLATAAGIVVDHVRQIIDPH